MGRFAPMLVIVLLLGLVVVRPAGAQEGFTRVAGEDRIATAIDLSQEFWPDGSASVVLARSDDYPDALAGGPLADLAGAPILLTPTERLDERVLAEIERLAAENVYVLGGPAAVAPPVEAALPATLTVRRFGGADRYETAELIDAAINASATLPDAAVVATGENFPDALMAVDLLPPRILLSRQDRFTSYDPDYSYTLVGGTSVLGADVQAQTSGTRLAGNGRYDTAARVLDASAAVRGPGPLFLATGGNAPDALAAGGAVARTGGYLLVVDPLLGLDEEQTRVLEEHAEDFSALWVLGGTAVVPDGVANTVADVLAETVPAETPSGTPGAPGDGPVIESASGFSIWTLRFDQAMDRDVTAYEFTMQNADNEAFGVTCAGEVLSNGKVDATCALSTDGTTLTVNTIEGAQLLVYPVEIIGTGAAVTSAGGNAVNLADSPDTTLEGRGGGGDGDGDEATDPPPDGDEPDNGEPNGEDDPGDGDPGDD